MNHDAQRIKEEYHAKLVKEGYAVRTQLPFEGIAGKFSLYAIHGKTGREKLVQVQDFSDSQDKEVILRSLEKLAEAKTHIELATLERRTEKSSSLELELVATNISPQMNNQVCASLRNAYTEYRQGILHARIYTHINQPRPTRRFVLV